MNEEKLLQVLKQYIVSRNKEPRPQVEKYRRKTISSGKSASHTDKPPM